MNPSFHPYIERVEHQIASFIPTLGPKTKLRDAIEYALLKGGGKRFRPSIVLMMAKELQKQEPPMEAALAVEFFHTASLIADDLPCMDDEKYRRGKASLHRAFDEAIALLATYALIAEGYKKISQGNKKITSEVAALALESATANTGIRGATAGQFFDLYPPQSIDEALVCEIMRMKTGALFELSFVFGWLFGGGEVSRLDVVKLSAHHFGMAYQIADDLDDLQSDKARNSKINFAEVCGVEKARERMAQEAGAFQRTLKELNLSLLSLQTIAAAGSSSSSSIGAEVLGRDRAATSA